MLKFGTLELLVGRVALMAVALHVLKSYNLQLTFHSQGLCMEGACKWRCVVQHDLTGGSEHSIYLLACEPAARR